MYDLSIIIPSFNTKDITHKCITLLLKNLTNTSLRYQIIVVDNHSVDGSETMLKTFQNKDFIVIINSENFGYAKANNIGLKYAKGSAILYLNSDVLIDESLLFSQILNYLNDHSEIAGLTSKVILKTGQLDMACHRGFPTIWRSFCYFSKLEYVFKHTPFLNKVFGGYHLWDRLDETIHEIDSPSGAFFLVKKQIVEKIGGFDQDYFMYGEDLDLSYRIKKLGFKIVYYPLFIVTHLKGKSGIDQNKKNQGIQIKSKIAFFVSMGIFYKKHFYSLYPRLLSDLILIIITQITKHYEKDRN